MLFSNTKCRSAALLLSLCVPLGMAAAPSWAADSQKQVKEVANPYAYDFKIKGVKDVDLREELTKAAQLTTLKDVKLTSERGLTRRIESDVDTFKIMLRAHGYFDADIRYKIKHDDKYHVTFSVDQKTLYKIGDVRLFLTAKKDGAKARALVDQALAKGEFSFPRGKDALPEMIQTPEQATLSVLMQNGYPYPYVTDRKLIVDHAKKTVDVHLSLNAGPRAVFGHTALQGLETVEAPFIERRVAWERGEAFDIRKVTKTQRDVSRSGVIGSARVQYGGKPAAPQEKATRIRDGASLPMRVVMDESDHRTIGAGVSYSTSLGPAANVFWEHRNVFGQAERFRADMDIGTSIYGVGATFNKPDLMGYRSLSYQSSFRAKDEELEAYDRKGVNVTNGVTWQATNRLSFNGGVGLEHARIKEKDRDEDTFTLVSVPLQAKYDSSDDLLNPQKGWRLALGVTPYKTVTDSMAFVHNDISAIHYWPLSTDLVWANRAKLGALYGDNNQDIPADKRLYSGGGGSVRGYGFQMVGPLDGNNDPTGGRMQVEFSTEMRYKVTEDFGAVGFFDAGQVSEDIGLDGDMLYSAGVGVRYYTVAGPVRFDVAVPLNKRPADDSFQIYISLGQAF